MPIFKKLLFLPIFLISFTTFIYLLTPIFKSYDFVFSFSSANLIQLVIICIILSLSSFLFVMFVTFSDWKFILPVGILALISPFLFLEANLAAILLVGILISSTLAYLNLQTSLKSYFNFSPSAIFGPIIRQLSALLILSICIVYFFSTSKMIALKGFQIPDSLIDASLKFSGVDTSSLPQTNIPKISIPKEQLDVLKKNPDLLKQSGIDPSILDSLDSKNIVVPKNIVGGSIKQAVKDQFENLIKPYLIFIPAVLAVLLFFTLQFLISIINLLIYPLLSLTFYILEKAKFISFTTEQRTVKKIVV